MKIIIGLVTFLILSGCKPWISPELPAESGSLITVSGNQTLGQTFVARLDGLEGIELRLSPSEDFDSEIHIHLRSDPEASQDLSFRNIRKGAVSDPGIYRFSFEAQPSSTQQYYYFFIEFMGVGTLTIDTAPGDSYLEGALYQDHKPIDLQMTFHPVYDLWYAVRGLLKEALAAIGTLLEAGFLFILPGLALLLLFYKQTSSLSIFSQLALSGSISLAIYPVLFLWTDVLGLDLGSLYAWLPPSLGLIFLIWHYRARRPSARIRILVSNWYGSDSFLVDSILIFLLAALLFTRLYQIRVLDIPLWGDSVHHTMISQLLVQNNGLFDSWAPLAELESLTYHFGFHANTAVFHWITGKSLPQSVLWSGQIINFLAIFSLYPLVQKAGGRKWGGIIVLLIAGLISPMPNFYLNWGRYSQLAGQAILPGVVFLIWETIEAKAKTWPLLGLTCVALAGLGLTHYRVLIFAIIFFIPLIIMNVKNKNVFQLLLRPFLIGLGAGLIFVPWLINTFRGRITTNFLRSLTVPAKAVTDWTQQYNAIGDLSQYLPTFLWILFAVTVFLAVIKRMKGTIVIILWWILILLATNPQWIHLPGEGAISNFAFFIAVYIPCSLTIGIVCGQLLRDRTRFLMKTIAILVICLSIVGIKQRLTDLDYRNHTLVTTPDIRASEWIRQNTTTEAKFLTNAFFAYNNTVIVGSDGGWWLPMLADRSITLPPTSYGTEKGPRPDYRVWTNALIEEIDSKKITDPDVLKMLNDRDVTNIYIGQLNGRVNNPGPELLPLELLLTSDYFEPVYHQDRVWVFEILYELDNPDNLE